jgi:ribosomal protein L24E
MYREVDQMPKCANCGILITRGEREFEHHGVTLLTCSERCERIYDTYTFPRHREAILAAEATA